MNSRSLFFLRTSFLVVLSTAMSLPLLILSLPRAGPSATAGRLGCGKRIARASEAGCMLLHACKSPVTHVFMHVCLHAWRNACLSSSHLLSLTLFLVSLSLNPLNLRRQDQGVKEQDWNR